MTIIHISSLNASFFQMFLEHMKKSHHRLSVCVNDPSVDNIHDLRTSIRRMTTIYKILSKYLKKKKIKKFVKQYQLLFKSSSIIRDYDILSEKISFYGFSELTFIQYLKKQREKKITNVLNQSSLLLTLEVPTISEFNFIDEINMFFTEKCLELILEIQTNFPIIIQDQTKIKELHSMRKTVKKLRYLLEFLPEDSISQISKDLKQLQDLLGDIHDNDMTILFFQKKIDKFNSLKPLILLEKESRDANFKKLVQHNSLLSTNG